MCYGSVLLVLLALALVPAAASATGPGVPIGDPIPPTLPPWLVPTEGTWQIEPALVPDPDGGPPWAIGTLEARADFLPVPLICEALGRVVNGRLGRLDAAGVR